MVNEPHEVIVPLVGKEMVNESMVNEPIVNILSFV